MSNQTNVMPPTPQVSAHRMRRGLLALLIVILASVLGLWLRRNGRTVPDGASVTTAQLPGANPSSPGPNGAAPMPVEVLSTTLGPKGFTPTTLKHPAGSFRLKVNNQSKQEEIVLRLSNATGEKLSEVTVTNSVHAWVGKFELGPGTYTLSEAAHPKWTCQITVAGPE